MEAFHGTIVMTCAIILKSKKNHYGKWSCSLRLKAPLLRSILTVRSSYSRPVINVKTRAIGTTLITKDGDYLRVTHYPGGNRVLLNRLSDLQIVQIRLLRTID